MIYEKKRHFPKKEGAFLKEFMKEFKKDSKCWYFKTHGEPMQVRGIPDVIICYSGLFVSIEFKVLRKGKLNITPYQEYTAEKIQSAKGMHFFIWHDENNGQVGIGVKRFDDKIQAATHLRKVLGNFIGRVRLEE